MMVEEVDREAAHEVALIEYGFTSCERGWNLEKTLDKANRLQYRQQPAPKASQVEEAIAFLDRNWRPFKPYKDRFRIIVTELRRLQEQRPEPARAVVTEELQRLKETIYQAFLICDADSDVFDLLDSAHEQMNALLASASRGGESAEGTDGEPV